MKPIGYVKSPFLFKNGTPRQPSVCRQARGVITIEKSIFNNPEHSLEGLQDFTHVWILFIFHQNNNSYTKSKVKPPRLNGKRVGLFSTRSPYRPNNIGLTLAKIEQIQGASLTVSGIDMIDGTPVIDIKPYITQYDCPSEIRDEPVDQEITDDKLCHELSSEWTDDICGNSQAEPIADFDNFHDYESKSSAGVCDIGQDISEKVENNKSFQLVEAQPKETSDNMEGTDSMKNEKVNSGFAKVDCRNIGEDVRDRTSDLGKNDFTISSVSETQVHRSGEKSDDKLLSGTGNMESLKVDVFDDTAERHGVKYENGSRTARWIEKPPIKSLNVSFTPTALEQLETFSLESENPIFRLQLLQNIEGAKSAIINILREDPRSTYRRKHCRDSLYYFTIDVIHVTCWFDEDTHTAEVVRIKPACLVEQCKQKFNPLQDN